MRWDSFRVADRSFSILDCHMCGLAVLRPSHQGTAAVAAIQASKSPCPQIDSQCPRDGDLILKGMPSARFAGGLSPFARCGNELVDMTQDLLGGHQAEVIRSRRYRNIAFGEFTSEDTAVEILKFQTG